VRFLPPVITVRTRITRKKQDLIDPFTSIRKNSPAMQKSLASADANSTFVNLGRD
jgi:hypothetical protein